MLFRLLPFLLLRSFRPLRFFSLLLGMSIVSGAVPETSGQGTELRVGGEEGQKGEVMVYRACESATPGGLIPLARRIPPGADAFTSALEYLVEGVSVEERSMGCFSYFSSLTRGAVREVLRDEGGSLVVVNFRDFRDALPDDPLVRSFLPPGIMAELGWTIFAQFPEVEAVRLSFDGNEEAFWRWLAGRDTREPRLFTRRMWEQI